MEQYIPKSALVAEINRLRKKNDTYDKPSHIADVCYKEILSFIDTLEVKEIGVDIGSPDGDIGVKTIWDGDKIISNKVQKGEEL